MGQLAREMVEIKDFPGLLTRADPDDLPPGAAVEQTNLASLRTGELCTREGCVPVTFEED